MPLSAGDKLGPYEIIEPIGKGGMGEVYRARDPRMGREVAVKVSAEQFSERFSREVHAIAALNHPNVCTLYDVGPNYLVMELVEGPTLVDRIQEGAIPIEEALAMARQIANALEAAHAKGITHRDLKPGNIKVKPDGTVKVLDFGLAKVGPRTASGSEANIEESPTISMAATRAGVILGTAAYMAPEQARGKPVDKRADIWAFGVVLYEMVTGKRLFQGEDLTETLASVVKENPNLAPVPDRVRRVIEKCLEKNPDQRLRDIGDWTLLLDGGSARSLQPAEVRGRNGQWPAVAAALVLISAALGLVAWKHFQEEPAHVVRFDLPPPGKGLFPPNLPTMAVSPDGRRVAFETLEGGKRELWVRDLANPAPRKLADLALSAPEIPFWAPDSRRLAFFDGTKLKKIDVTGGPGVTIADTGSIGAGSGSWNQDDVIVFGKLTAPVFRVPAAGGSPAPVTSLDQSRGETGHWAPWFLPDGRHFLYLAQSSNPEKSAVYVGDLTSQTRKPVIAFGTRAIYADPGYLLFARDRTLMAQPFNPSKLETTGDAVPVAEQVDAFATRGLVLGHFSASRNGVLMYTTGGAGGTVQLIWFDRAGKRLDTAGAPGNLEWFSVSPDGSSIALTRLDPQTGRYDVWTRDLAHQSESRLTFMGNNRFPVWSADGTRLFFLSDREGPGKIYQQAANGTGSVDLVDASGPAPTDASRDGRYLFTVTPGSNPKTGNDIWVHPLFGDGKPFPYVATEFQELWPRISPDGRWLAYQSNATNRFEVYVVSFPQPGGKWQVSTGGGSDPVWSRDGRELYYYSADNKIMAVPIKGGASFQFGVPQALFEVNLAGNNVSFDVSKDGRFLLSVQADQAVSAPMSVVLNWPAELKK